MPFYQSFECGVVALRNLQHQNNIRVSNSCLFIGKGRKNRGYSEEVIERGSG